MNKIMLFWMILFILGTGYCAHDILGEELGPEWIPLERQLLIGVEKSCCYNEEENTVIIRMKNGTIFQLKGIWNEKGENKIYVRVLDLWE